MSGGDYPAVDTSSYGACISNNGERPCDNLLLEYAPILHFGSVFRNALFPNMIAMPMPRSHTDCFVNWLMHDRKRCDLFLPVESDATWDELIPQLVWRGTDFMYLAFQNNLERPTYERYIEGRTNPNANQKKAATTILRENFAKLVPRWKTVVYTAESEIEAARSNTLPQVNCKFSSVPYGGKHAAIGAPEYKKWEEIDFPVAGEGMDEDQLSKFKYHIDTGGGGGKSFASSYSFIFHSFLPFFLPRRPQVLLGLEQVRDSLLLQLLSFNLLLFLPIVLPFNSPKTWNARSTIPSHHTHTGLHPRSNSSLGALRSSARRSYRFDGKVGMGRDPPR